MLFFLFINYFVWPLRKHAKRFYKIPVKVLAWSPKNFTPEEADWRLFEQVYFFKRYENDKFEQRKFSNFYSKKLRILEKEEEKNEEIFS